MEPEILLLPSDAGRELNLTPAGVRRLVAVGQLEPKAKTRKGANLFTPESVETLRQQREARSGAKAR
jgi:hypothetical protein